MFKIGQTSLGGNETGSDHLKNALTVYSRIRIQHGNCSESSMEAASSAEAGSQLNSMLELTQSTAPHIDMIFNFPLSKSPKVILEQ